MANNRHDSQQTVREIDFDQLFATIISLRCFKYCGAEHRDQDEDIYKEHFPGKPIMIISTNIWNHGRWREEFEGGGSCVLRNI